MSDYRIETATERLAAQGIDAEGNVHWSHKPDFVPVSQICQASGYLEFGMNQPAVEGGVMRIMSAIEHLKADEAVAAIGICFVMIASRFNLRIPSYLSFVEAYLFRGGDQKLGCHGLNYFLNRLYKDYVVRYRKVSFRKPVDTKTGKVVK